LPNGFPHFGPSSPIPPLSTWAGSGTNGNQDRKSQSHFLFVTPSSAFSAEKGDTRIIVKMSWNK